MPVPESWHMTAGEFIRRVTTLGSARGVPVRFDATRGPGLLNKMLADLGLNRRDLR